MTLKGWRRRPHTELPPDWEQRRAMVLARDGHRCVDCGSTQRLEVVHIADLDDHAPSTLRTLCAHCRAKSTVRRHPAA
jgi:5-methylcytosine-specific restriction endonuclease McrA